MKKYIKIALISDIHVRPHQYMDEMQFTFDELFQSIKEKNAELVVIGGDFFHSKLTVSNEYFQIAFNFFRDLSEICQSIVIPGNHDSVLSNQGRLDAITPVVNAVNEFGKHHIWYLTKSESLSLTEEMRDFTNSPDINFHHFSIHDQKSKWPSREEIDSSKINIALYHGCIENCKLDNGWVSRGNRDNISIFDGFDYGFLGDIHKRQFLNADKTIAYPGSLRQNNFGEDVDKGYLLWTIRGKDDFDVEEVILPQKRYFFTFYLESIQDVEQIGDLPEDCRIRVKSLKQFDVAEEIEIKKAIIEKYKPSGEILIIPPDEKIENSNVKVGNLDIIHDNIRDIEIQKQLISEYLKKKNLDEKVIAKIVELDKKYHSSVDTDVLRNIIYDIKSVKFDNFFSYGKDNKIDLTKLKGMIGVFGPNGTGKSSIFDVISFAFYNSINKEGANKNGDYVNRKCKKAEVKLDIEFNKNNFSIQREIKKVYSENKTEPKIENSVDFYKNPKTKDSMLNGETIPETNKFIRDIFGQKEDFEITSYIPQFGLTNFIDSRGTKRKEGLSKFFDLGVFDTKYSLALEDHREIKSKLKSCNKTELLKESETIESTVVELEEEKIKTLSLIESLEKDLSYKDSEIFSLAEKKTPIGGGVQKFDEEKISQLQKQLEELYKLDDSVINSLNLTIADLQEKKSRHAKVKFQLNLFKQNSDLISKIPNQEICKTCSVASSAYDAKTKYEESEIELSKIDFDQSKLNQAEAQAEIVRKNLELRKQIQRQLDLGRKYLENKTLIELNEKIDEKISELRKQKHSIEESIKKCRDSLSLSEQKIGFNLAKFSEIESKIEMEKGLSENDKLYSIYLDCMSKDGISYWIISKKLILINKLVNQIISHAVPYKFLIEDNEEEKSIKMFILQDGSKTPVELASGGEKTIIALALRAALWKISLLPKTPILILDESLSFLDSEKYDSTIKLLKYLSSNYFEKIFIITHNEELKRIMDDMMYVSKKKNGFSFCEVK